MNSQPFQVELSGIIKILSDHLYSRDEVFIRELIQNAADAILARKRQEEFEPEVLIEYFDNDESAGIVVSDNGIGLTESQITEFLARIGSSSKSADKYGELRSDFIGQFGIGILSCFMVSDEITLLTRSANGSETFRWTGYINGTYKVEKATESLTTGTKVVLKLRKGTDISENKLRHNISHYAGHIDLPILLEANGGEARQINQLFPWEANEGNHLLLTKGYEIFDQSFSNCFVLKPTEICPAEGLVYILPFTDHLSNQSAGRLYVKRMFITEKCGDFLPDWAFFVKVIINTNDLGLNASRESIYPDDRCDLLKEHIGNAIKQYLRELASKTPKALRQIIASHSAALKKMALSDPDFLQFVYQWFTFPTSHGQMTLEEIKEQATSVYYVSDIDEFRQVVPVAMGNNQLVVNAGYLHDAAVLQRIAKIDRSKNYIEADAAFFGNFLEEIPLDEYEAFKSRLTALQAHLDKFNCRIALKQFDPENIPAIYHANMDTQLARDIDEISATANSDWAAITENVFGNMESHSSTIYLNYNNRIVKSLIKNSSNFDRPVVETLLTNAMLMGHYPLNFLELETMNHNLNQLATLALSQ
ncbi:MAG: HSP90 family protein [Roseivirga sp.]|nr:HSP90 family protein [Roseivirga sp.]